jgi:hypothetical protein
MSQYAQSLSDVDLGQIGTNIIASAESAAENAVRQAEDAAKAAASGVVQSASAAVERGISNIVGGGSTTPSTSTFPPVQAAEKPVGTTTQQPGGMLSGLPNWAIPAGVGVGVYYWQKSILWAAVGAGSAWYIAKKMRKGGN